MKWLPLTKWFFFNREYLRHPRWETGITPLELIAYAQNHLPGNALEIGCGSGLNSVYLADQGWTVDAVDFSFLAIRKARKREQKSNNPVRWMIGDAARLSGLPLRPPYDLILDIGCLHGLGNEQSARAYANSVSTLLKPGGDYILYTHEYAITDSEYPSHGLNVEWIRRLFVPALEMMEHIHGDEKIPGMENLNKRQAAWYYLKKPIL